MLRRNAIWAALVVGVAIVQTTWLEALLFAGVLPDLVLVLVVFFAIAEGEERAMLTGAVGGVFQDVASGAVLGHHVLCYVVVAFVLGRVSSRLITEHPAVKAGLVLLAAFVRGVLFTAVFCIQNPGVRLVHSIVATVIPAAFYTAIVSPVVFMLMDRTYGRGQIYQGARPDV